ncbi:hypothetical protein GEMRC1_010279 [Eukaryota sp. GEM-RC1]
MKDILRGNMSLLHVDLFNNLIDDKEAKSLLQALRCNSTLRSLDLSGNLIENLTAAKIDECLSTNRSLRTLDVSMNYISVENAAEMALYVKLKKLASFVRWSTFFGRVRETPLPDMSIFLNIPLSVLSFLKRIEVLPTSLLKGYENFPRQPFLCQSLFFQEKNGNKLGKSKPISRTKPRSKKEISSPMFLIKEQTELNSTAVDSLIENYITSYDEEDLSLTDLHVTSPESSSYSLVEVSPAAPTEKINHLTIFNWRHSRYI